MTVRQGTFTAIVAMLACVFAFAAAAPRAHAARGMEVALMDDAVLLQRVYYDRDRALRQIRALGVTRLRVNLIWTRVLPDWQEGRHEPAIPYYDWSMYDNLIGAAAAHGMRVQLTVSGPAPAWATGNHRRGVYRPRADKFASFVRAAAVHFRGRVDRYTIWNEPNHVGWLRPLRRSPSLYRNLYASGYRAVKSVDPGAQVLFGETSPYRDKGRAWAPIKFLRRATCVDNHWHRHCPSSLYADGYAHHPYEFRHKPSYHYPGRDNATMGTLGHLTKALRRLAHGRALRTPRGHALPLYLTEYGYFGTGRRRVSASRRARYLRQAFRMARRNPHVRQLLQYQLVSPPRRFTTFDTALLGRSGHTTRVYNALRKVAR